MKTRRFLVPVRGNRFLGLYVGRVYVGLVLSLFWLRHPWRHCLLIWDWNGHSPIVRVGPVVVTWCRAGGPR